jgi:hypothetical protein
VAIVSGGNLDAGLRAELVNEVGSITV